MPIFASANVGGTTSPGSIPAPPANKPVTVIDWAFLSCFSASGNSTFRLQALCTGAGVPLGSGNPFHLAVVANAGSGAGSGGGSFYATFKPGIVVCAIASSVAISVANVNGAPANYSCAIGYHYE